MSVSLFNICTDSKESKCPSTCGKQGGQGRHAACQTGQHCPGPLQNFAVMEQKPMLHMHAAGWEVERADTAGRLQSGSRARRGEAGSSYTAQSKSPWTGLRQKVSVGRNERTSKLSVPTPARPLPFLQRQMYIKQFLDSTEHQTHSGMRVGAGVW